MLASLHFVHLVLQKSGQLLLRTLPLCSYFQHCLLQHSLNQSLLDFAVEGASVLEVEGEGAPDLFFQRSPIRNSHLDGLAVSCDVALALLAGAVALEVFGLGMRIAFPSHFGRKGTSSKGGLGLWGCEIGVVVSEDLLAGDISLGTFLDLEHPPNCHF